MASAVPNVQAVKREPIVRKTDRSSAMAERTGVVGIGKSIVIKGELSGNEDLTIEGRVEGKIDLNQNLLTVGENGKVKAQVFAKTVVVIGEVLGNVTAVEKCSIQEKGAVDGDISAPRVAIAEGAHFRGSIDMRRSQSAKPAVAAVASGSAGASNAPRAVSSAKPESVPAPAPAPAAPALKS
ncbi:MAG: polymer-forming cytoskeletal protein [Acidobacteria bacterium]|nr:polymer-forming cytoskeletal protein [Acidobacteriota bacterium]